MNNPSIMSLTNLGAAPPSHIVVREANYIRSPTDARLPGPLVDQALVPRNLPPSQEDCTLLEEDEFAKHPPPRHKRSKTFFSGISH